MTALTLCSLSDILDSYAEELGVKVELNDCHELMSETQLEAMDRTIWDDIISISVDGEPINLRLIGEHDDWVVVQRRPYRVDENTRQFAWEVIGDSEGNLTTSRLICAVLTSFA